MNTDETRSRRLYAPWSQEIADALNSYQEAGIMHPFTCPDRQDGAHLEWEGRDLGALVAYPAGWVCPDCGYQQFWAHGFMADPRWDLHV